MSWKKIIHKLLIKTKITKKYFYDFPNNKFSLYYDDDEEDNNDSKRNIVQLVTVEL